jgi:hypothetical protein
VSFTFGPAWARDTGCCAKPVGCTNMSPACLMLRHPWKRRFAVRSPVTTGRRVQSIDEIERPGDYYGPVSGYTGGKEACFYKGPACEHLGHVTFPPHTYRECLDGSLEIRASILNHAHGDCPEWHGYLDEGHTWRQL